MEKDKGTVKRNPGVFCVILSRPALLSIRSAGTVRSRFAGAFFPTLQTENKKNQKNFVFFLFLLLSF